MKIFLILKLLFIFIIISLATPQKLYAEKTKFLSEINFVNNDFYLDKNNHVKFRIHKKNKNFVSQIDLNVENEKKINFDNSYLQYENSYLNFGIGKIDRHWSLSEKTSLILSDNSRPPDSVYLKFASSSKSKYPVLSYLGPWSIEVFNAVQSNNTAIKKNMLLGMRALIEPTNNFKLELVRTAQWGGYGYNNSLGTFLKILAGHDTNDGNLSNVNQLAGVGFSYLIPFKQSKTKIYAQTIGEDQSGGLPNCFLNLIGSEIKFSNGGIIEKIGFEYVDTRVKLTSHGNCGANTAYNNNIYNYTNYDKSLGAAIDSEGKSYSFWAAHKLTPQLDLKYLIESIAINDKNSANHRLSSTKQNGFLGSLGLSWEKENFSTEAKIGYQNFSLDKINISKGVNLSIKTIYNF
jgi:hypothetical protein